MKIRDKIMIEIIKNSTIDDYNKSKYSFTGEQMDKAIDDVVKLLHMPDRNNSVCDTCAYLKSSVYHDMMWCRDCKQGNHFKQTDG